MDIQKIIENHIHALLNSPGWNIGTIQKTKKEFVGDFSINVFPIYRSLKTLGSVPGSREELKKHSAMSIEEFTNELSNYLKTNEPQIESINTIKGFINILLKDSYWTNFFTSIQEQNFGITEPNGSSETVMVEFSSPNTNKPLHLGHVRNNLLGASISEILKAAGKKVIRVNLVNDRGIHICKSMLAWKKWGNGETPESSGMKGDHLVGKYYVLFESELKKQAEETLNNKANEILKVVGVNEKKYSTEILKEILPFYSDNDISDLLIQLLTAIAKEGKTNSVEFLKDDIEKFRQQTKLMGEVQDMLRKWEAGDKETVDLWKKMNGWVYDGFAKTYKELGIEFEKTYYESQTYLLGKEIVEEGVRKNVFKRREDDSVWVDLTAEGLDEKLLLRSDGTSVYITQDLGTIIQRANEFHFNKHIYVVGNEQDYHFKVLFLILKKLGYDWADKLFHLSYGMVDLPSGKMKSREGTVVDADELMHEMVSTAGETTKALGKTEGMSAAEAESLYRTIGLGALKYFILKVDPKKRMLFDPKESIDFNGNTGPFIQYTYARIKSVMRKAEGMKLEVRSEKSEGKLHSKEKEVIKLLHGFPAAVQEAANAYNPGHIANYVYELAREYNQFYHEIPILKSENAEEKNFRLLLSAKTAEVIKTSLQLLGIPVPERM